MSVALTWLAVRGKTRTQVLQELGLAPSAKSGRRSYALLPDGGHLVVWENAKELAPERIKKLSLNASATSCLVEEHVMFSRAQHWVEGQLQWSVVHNPDRGLLNLETVGDPPSQLIAFREQALREQKEARENVDCMFDVPVKTAALLVPYRYDQESGLNFEFLELASKPPFWRQILGHN